MDLNRSNQAVGAKPARTTSAETEQNNLQGGRRGESRPPLWADEAGKPTGYGLPCSRCRLYYPANLDICPTCHSRERVSPNVVPAVPKVQSAAEPLPDNSILEKEREAFLKEFKSQLFAAHTEVTNSPAVCSMTEHHNQDAEVATICKPCYERLQERLDVCEAALHIDLKEAAQIVYDAVWADPSDPGKTYTNAASALLGELRKRSGVSSLLGPFQPLGN